MNRTLMESLRYGLEAAWRRRHLVLLPLLASIPLSLLAAVLLPQSYTARTLLLLQETGRENPLSRETLPGDGVRDRVAGVEAFIRSEHILLPVMADVLGPKFPKDAKEQARLVQDWGKDLSVQLIGRDFMEFRLKGSDPQGLGKSLEGITLRFLESLLLDDQHAVAAPQMLLKRHADELKAAEKALEEERKRVEAAGGDGNAVKSDIARLAELERNVATKAEQLKSVDNDVATLLKSLGEGAPTAADVAGAVTKAEAAANAADAPAAAKTRLEELVTLQRLYARQSESASAASAARAQLANLQTTLSSQQRSMRQLDILTNDVEQLRLRYEYSKRRYASQTGGRSINLLRAPESIRVIDPPKDPTLPTTRKLMVLLAGLFAGLVIGLSSAVVAEAFDGRVYSAEDASRHVEAPVWTRLPRVDDAIGAGTTTDVDDDAGDTNVRKLSRGR